MPDFAVSAIFGARGAQFTSTMGTMRTAVRGFGSDIKSAFLRAIPGATALTHAFKGIAGQFAIGNLIATGVHKLVSGVEDLAKEIPEFAERGELIARTALKLGISTDAFQRLQFAAKETETPMESVTGAMQKLNMGMAQVRVGAGPLHAMMQKINPVLATQLQHTTDSTKAFLLVGQAIRGTANAQTRAAIAQAAFGKSGQDLIPLFTKEDGTLDKLMATASDFTTILNDKSIAASERFADAWKHTTMVFGQLKDRVLGALVEKLTPLLEKALAWVEANKELIATRIGEWIDRVSTFAKAAYDRFAELNAFFHGHLIRNVLLLVGAIKGIGLALDIGAAVSTAIKLLGGLTAAAEAAGAAQAAATAAGGAGALAPAATAGLGALGPVAAALAAGAVFTYAGAKFDQRIREARDPNKVFEKKIAALSALPSLQDNLAGAYAGSVSPALMGLGSGGLSTPAAPAPEAPPAAQPNVSVLLKNFIDNAKAPGVTSTVRTAPPLVNTGGQRQSATGTR